MRVLLLGGTGAMGISLIEILSRNGYDVYVTSRKERESKKNITYIKGDAHDLVFMNSILKNRYDAIIDFMVYDIHEFKSRVELLLCATNQYIFTSSSRVYANIDRIITENSPRLLDISTDSEYLKSNEYGLLKAKEENILFDSTQKNWTIIRPYITYNVDRLQLGGIEKDVWLNRALNGRSIPFPKDVANHYTTLSYGADVAEGIAALIGNTKAFGEVFNITSNEHLLWRDILEIYLKVLESELKLKPKVFIPENSDKLSLIMGNKYQMQYDRLFDRIFDNSKLMNACDKKIDFTLIEDGLTKCLTKSIKKEFTHCNLNPELEGYLNRMSNDEVMLAEFDRSVNIIKYIGWRYSPNLFTLLKKISKYIKKKI